MNISQNKKKIVLLFIVLFSILFIFFGIVNSSFFQKKIFSIYSKKFQEKYTISIDSNSFYYNIFSNRISCNFLVLDHYQKPMIKIPDISIGLKNNIIFSKSDLIFEKIDIKDVVFFIKKYEQDSISNLEFFLKKISHERASNIDSMLIENISFEVSEINFQNEMDTLVFNNFNLGCDSFSFSKANGLKVKNILLNKGESSIALSFESNNLKNSKSDTTKWSLDINKGKVNLDDFLNTNSIKNKFFVFSGKLEETDLDFLFNIKNFEYDNSFLKGKLFYEKRTQNFLLEIDDSFIKQTDFLSFFNNKYSIPKPILDLGDIIYTGRNVLYDKNLNIDGRMDSDHGLSYFNLNFILGDTLLNSSYEGSLNLENFDIGSYLKNNNFGIINFQTFIKGSGLSKENFSANIDLKEGSVFFNKYSYKNISLIGDFSYDFFKGDFLVNDKNCNIQFSGLIDFSKTKPIFDFSTKFSRVDFKKINFPINPLIKQFSGVFSVNLSGSSVDNLNGVFLAKKMSYYRGRKYNLNNLNLNFKNNSKAKLVKLNSDLGNASLSGDFLFSDLIKNYKEIIKSFFENKNINFNKKYNFELDLDVKKSSFFTDLFLEKFSLGNCVLNIKKDNLNNNILATGNLKNLSFGDNYFNEIKLDFNAKNYNDLTFSLFSENFKNKKRNIHVDTLIFNSNSISKKINYQLSFNNINDNNEFDASFSGDISKGIKNIISFGPSFIRFSDNLWELSSNSSIIISDFKDINFSNFTFFSKDQLIEVSGGNSNSLKLYFDLKNVDLALVNYFRKKDASKLSGLVNGTFWFSSIKKPLGGYFKVRGFSMNDILLGDLILNAQSNDKRKYLALNGYVKPFQKPKTIDLNGTISLDSKKNMNMFLDFHGQDCNLINPFLNSISNTKGKIYGKANFYGPHDNYFIDGEISVKNLSFKVPYLNTSYYLKDDYKIFCKKDQISLDTIVFYDKKHNTNGKFFGNVIHSNALKKMNYDIFISSDNLYCLNTKIENNDVYYGDVFAAGDISIDGNPDNVYFNINAESKKGTKFNIPLSSSTEISDENNLEIFNSSQIISSKITEEERIINQENDFKMDFNLDLNPNAQVQIIYDEKIGDIIKGSGEGDLKLEIDQNGKFNMYGEVLVNEGEYLYTMQNVLNKNFKIEKGGMLYWNGNPYDIIIDFFAYYELKTSLNLLDPDYSSTTKVPVFCKMHMTKSLLKPTVDFLIDIPSASDVALTKLYQLTDSEEKKLQQFLFLIGANSFLIQESTENYLNSSLTTTGTELLSNQISNWLSQITDDFDLGFRWTPGSTDSLTTDEIQLALSMKLLNDKLTINGNASNPSTPQAQDNTDVVGELDIQYELTNNLKLTAFSRTDEYDPISGNEFRYEQGVSIFFEKEFDSFFDIFRKKRKKKKQKRNKKQKTKN